MRGRVALWILAGSVSLATAHAQPEGDLPPPRGSEHPRLQGMPGDRDNPIPPDRTDESFTPRVPNLEATSVDDARQARRAGETVDVETAPPPRGLACGDLAADERMSCPITAADGIQPIQDGVRVRLPRGKFAAAHVRQVLECHAALAETSTEAVPPCAFLGNGRRATVVERNGRVTVDIISTDGDAADVVRQEVRTALRGRQALPSTSRSRR